MIPRYVLDLFCRAGGASMGLHRAWPDALITGVDINPQPRYPAFHDAPYASCFRFVQADAMTFDLSGYDFIWASPPCQGYSEATPVKHRGNHPDLIGPTRDRLLTSGNPFVIENVENARAMLVNPIMLCGSMFGLTFWRHRYFEIHPSSFWLMPPCNHKRYPISVTCSGVVFHTWVPVLCTGGGDGKLASRRHHRPRERVDVIRWAMDTDWMTQSELTEAVPPAYSEFIARQLTATLEVTG